MRYNNKISSIVEFTLNNIIQIKEWMVLQRMHSKRSKTLTLPNSKDRILKSQSLKWS